VAQFFFQQLSLGTESRERHYLSVFSRSQVMQRVMPTLVSLFGALSPLFFALPADAADQAAAAPASITRDGAHDFDFNFGMWKSHITRLVHPLTESKESVELNGTVTVRKVWDGKAALEEMEADGPKGHWEGMSLFLYNPQSHEWSQTFINSAQGVFAGALTGSFHDGRGELYSQDTAAGRVVLVRGTWSNIAPDSHRYEEAYSSDGGKTWQTVFTADLTRQKS
jgi:hypothetical protein